MSRCAYVNGQYLPHNHASVHIEDRGYQFSDGVYEVVSIRQENLIDEVPHLKRLERSLGELKMQMPVSQPVLRLIMREVARRNRVKSGLIYIQVTRGTASRDHAFPTPSTPQSIIVTAKSLNMDAIEARFETGVSVSTTPDTRWARCDIKTIGLLPNVLAKQDAKLAGAYEAWFVDAVGCVTEGSSSNAWIVTQNQELQTRQLDRGILAGITRATLVKVAKARGLKLVEQPFTPREAQMACEAFMTSASAYVLPIVAVDGTSVGDGAPGPVAKALRDAYFTAVEDT